MAGKNKVTLTFAGDSKDLERTFDRVGESSRKMDRKVRDSTDVFDSFGEMGARSASGFGLSFSEKIGPLMAKLPISGPLSAVLAGAAAAAVPTIATAAVSGILLGLGGGVLVAGIVSAAKDPKVAAAFGGTAEKAKKAFAGFGEPFKAPMIRAAKTFGDAIERMAPAFKRMGEKMAPLIDKLAPALVSIAEKSMPGIEKAVAASVPLFEKIAEHAPAIGEAISKFFEAIAEGAPAAVKFIDVLLTAVEWVLPALGGTLKWLTKEFEKNLENWKAIFRGLGRLWNWVSGVASSVSGGISRAWNRVSSATATVINAVTNRFNRFVSFIRGIRGRIGGAFSGMFDGIRQAFRNSVNWVIDRWNNFSIPGISTPFGHIGGFSTPNLPRFHSGVDRVPGAPGTEMLAILQAGERVTPAGKSDRTVIELRSDGSRLGDLLVEVLARSIRVRGGDVQAVLGRG